MLEWCRIHITEKPFGWLKNMKNVCETLLKSSQSLQFKWGHRAQSTVHSLVNLLHTLRCLSTLFGNSIVYCPTWTACLTVTAERLSSVWVMHGFGNCVGWLVRQIQSNGSVAFVVHFHHKALIKYHFNARNGHTWTIYFHSIWFICGPLQRTRTHTKLSLKQCVRWICFGVL